jgi:hypothetical protein
MGLAAERGRDDALLGRELCPRAEVDDGGLWVPAEAVLDRMLSTAWHDSSKCSFLNAPTSKINAATALFNDT